MRMDLKVPFAEKDAAKKLGARWDAARKIWYVLAQGDVAPFAKWTPTPHEESPAQAAPGKSPSPKTQASGKVYVGSEYEPRARVCECLPWETCEKCQVKTG